MSGTTDPIIQVAEEGVIPCSTSHDIPSRTWTCDLTGLVYTDEEFYAICSEPPYIRRSKKGLALQGAWNYNWEYLSELSVDTKLALVADPEFRVGNIVYPDAVKVYHDDVMLGFVAECDNIPISRALLHGMYVKAVLTENRHGANYVRMKIEYDDLD